VAPGPQFIDPIDKKTCSVGKLAGRVPIMLHLNLIRARLSAFAKAILQYWEGDWSWGNYLATRATSLIGH
jgi:hypothetical protein